MKYVIGLFLITVIAAASMTGWVRRFAIQCGVIDQPNFRSSHSAPTPRGGGLAIVGPATLALLALYVIDVVDGRLALALIGGGGAIAAIGFMDDRTPLSARVRLLTHVLAAVWAVLLLGGLPPMSFGGRSVDLAILGDMIAVIAIVWVVNLFNFMDGIDGIAGSEAAFITLVGAALSLSAGSMAIAAAALVVCGASLGFLVWNWPPAKIFMGDVGSGYLGFVIAVLALGAARTGAETLYQWFILGSVFFVDATVTLIRRVTRGESLHVAHRSHVYQRFSRRWDSHGRVTIAVVLINFLWLAPWAVGVAIYPDHALWAIVCSTLPLVALAIIYGMGRAEEPQRCGGHPGWTDEGTK